MSSRVTIKSIAAELGISHMTVSRALSGNPNVQKQTREAVQKRARELGYVKSAAAKAMRGDGTQIVGLLLPSIVNEFYARFANTLALACEAAELQLIIHLTGDDIGAERQAIERLSEVQAQAVIMVPCPSNADDPMSIPPGMQIIQLIRERDMGQQVPLILVDDGQAISDAVLHLANKGHRRIAYIGADSVLSSGRSRLAAFQDGLAKAGLAQDPRLMFAGAPSFEMGRSHARDILSSNLATAQVCGGFEISNGALSALMDADPARSENFAFVGYGDPSFYSWIRGGVTTVSVPVDRLARAAIDLLSKGDRDVPAKRLQFPARLMDRG